MTLLLHLVLTPEFVATIFTTYHLFIVSSLFNTYTVIFSYFYCNDIKQLGGQQNMKLALVNATDCIVIKFSIK